MNQDELKYLQSLDLATKVSKTKQRIREWYKYWGGEVYVGFSGGKDSTVLADIVRSLYKEVPLVFVDTGLEYPEIKDFVHSYVSFPSNNKFQMKRGRGVHYYKDNLYILKPRMLFGSVLEQFGYPVISKINARFISDLQNPTMNNENTRRQRAFGVMKNGKKTQAGKLSKKWLELFFNIEECSRESCEYPIAYNDKNYCVINQADFKVSHKCCKVMKKEPFKYFGRQFNLKPIIGTMASESYNRKNNYLRYGCNMYNTDIPQSRPLGFWTSQDVLEYIYKNKLKIASVYGDVIREDGQFKTTGEKRTGCVFCMFGVHLEDEPNRFQRMKKTHPQLWDYCINNLGLKEVLEYIDVPYE